MSEENIDFMTCIVFVIMLAFVLMGVYHFASWAGEKVANAPNPDVIQCTAFCKSQDMKIGEAMPSVFVASTCTCIDSKLDTHCFVQLDGGYAKGTYGNCMG